MIGVVDDEAAWAEIDEMIVTRRIIAAMRAIEQVTGCSLPRTVELFSDRYGQLRERRPDDFTVGPDEYGHGVYT